MYCTRWHYSKEQKTIQKEKHPVVFLGKVIRKTIMSSCLLLYAAGSTSHLPFSEIDIVDMLLYFIYHH